MEYSLDTLAETPISKNFIDSKHFFRQKRKEIVNFKSLYNLISRLDRICWTSKFDVDCKLIEDCSKLAFFMNKRYWGRDLPKPNEELLKYLRFYYHKTMDYLVKRN